MKGGETCAKITKVYAARWQCATLKPAQKHKHGAVPSHSAKSKIWKRLMTSRKHGLWFHKAEVLLWDKWAERWLRRGSCWFSRKTGNVNRFDRP